MTKRTRRTIGISLLVSAFTLAALFIVSCFKKKSIWSAILALAALEGGAGACLLLAEGKKIGSGRHSFDTGLFEGKEEELGHREEEDTVYAPRPPREIPRDEEASEADFL